MKIYNAKDGADGAFFETLKNRTAVSSVDLSEKVKTIIDDVRLRGDMALREYSRIFDGVECENLEMSEKEKSELLEQIPKELFKTIEKAAENIRAYHTLQLCSGYETERNGRMLGRVVRPLERVGVYVPGGTAAYPSTVLMNCVPAAVAGVEEIILVTPPKKGGISPAVVAAAQVAGVKRIFTVGGAQAVAALAYGTDIIPKVDKIVGPGNVFVAEAKRQVFGKVDIDMIAGPSEVLIIADETADSELIAADLLSQLEHDRMASAVLITTSRKLAEKVSEQADKQLALLSRCDIATYSLAHYSAAIIVENIEQAFEKANAIAPEHLEILLENPYEYLGLVRNAGSIFLGEYSPEPLGDYFAGTNHVLPTNGTAKFSSPLSVDDFIKKMSYIRYSHSAFDEDAEDVIRFAEAEGLTAHANAVRKRIK